jgi:hypothetical protein
MKTSAPFCLLLAGMFAAGCAVQKDAFSPAAAASVPPAAIVTPDNSIAGIVVSYNSTGRFVVLNFPAGQMPGMEQVLFLYRAGLKTAEVKITGPQGNNNIVADLLTGDAQAGDEVRDK